VAEHRLTLEEAAEHVGHGVVYLPQHEDGVITSVNDRWVFVRYSGDSHSKATNAHDLTLLAEATR
jgi:hypothetical protein